KRGKILDLCTGNGVIPLLLSRRTNAEIVGVEIQQRIYDMAERNICLNDLDQQLSMIHGDLRKMQPVLGHSQFDVVTCNPRSEERRVGKECRTQLASERSKEKVGL